MNNTNNQTQNIMLGVVTGAIIGLATASLIYKKRRQEEALDGDVNYFNEDYCDCSNLDGEICDCNGTCECHGEEE